MTAKSKDETPELINRMIMDSSDPVDGKIYVKATVSRHEVVKEYVGFIEEVKPAFSLPKSEENDNGEKA